VYSIPRLAGLASTTLLLIVPTPASAALPPATSVTLGWTAPGDDGGIGRATQYILRYSTMPITEANFLSAEMVWSLPRPKPPGSHEQVTVVGLPGSGPFYFAVETLDNVGNKSRISNVAMAQSTTPVVDETIAIPISFSAPWPNPARESMRCAYALPHGAEVQVDVFDIAGRHVRTIAAEWREAGRGEIAWDLRDHGGRPVDAGIYFVRARLADRSWTRRVVVVH